MAKKKLTVNQQQWKKEVNRLKQFIRRAEKRGFTFDDVIPETPKRITKKQLNLIKSLTPNVLYSHASYTDPQTGQSMTGTEGRHLERSRAALKRFKPSTYNPPIEVDSVLYQIEQMIRDWKPFPNWSKYFTEVKREDKNRLKALLDGKIAEVGREETARRLQQNAEGINHMADEILYSSDEDAVNMDLNYIATVLKGSALTPDESSYYTQLAESYNESE